MARAYDDDLRRKFLAAHAEGVATLAELAKVFGVSLGWAKKVSAARKRTGKAERVPHRPGRKPRVGKDLHPTVLGWVEAEPDLTLVEVQAKLQREAGISLSVPRVWDLLGKLGFRLKKSRSTPGSGMPKPTSSGAKSLWRESPPSRPNV